MARRWEGWRALGVMATTSLQRLAPYLLLLLPPLLWAGHIVFARITIDEIPPVQLSLWRWTLSVLIILPLTCRPLISRWPIIRQRWRGILMLSTFGVTCFSSVLYYGLQTTTVINAGLWQTLSPIMILVLSWMLLAHPMTPVHLGAVGLAGLGAVIVLAQGHPGALLQLDFVWGDLLVLVATTSWALYSTLLKRNPLPFTPFESLTIQLLFALPALTLLAIIEGLIVGPATLSWAALGALVYIGPVAGALALALWIRGVAEVGPNIAGIYMNLIPVFAAVLGVLFLSETLYGYHIVGMLAIGSGIVLTAGLATPVRRHGGPRPRDDASAPGPDDGSGDSR